MKRNIFLIIFLVLGCQLDAQPAKNILLILSDDQSNHTIRALGNKEIFTPNLDQLVKEGLSFNQAHVMGGHQGAICIASRAMLMTGRYVNRIPNDGAIIPDSLYSLPEILRKAGFTTFHAGKWHNDKVSYNRMFSQGENIFFDGMLRPEDGGQEHPTVYSYDSSGKYEQNLMRRSDTFSSQLFADAAIHFLNAQKGNTKPFLCYLAFTSPHDPRTPPEKFRAMYDPLKISLPANFLPRHPFDQGDLNVRDERLLPHPLKPEDVKKEIALYYGMISEMDAQVGRVLEALERNGLKENTLVVFAGDNGLAVGQNGLLGKQNLYEPSIRVPLILRGPGIPKHAQTPSFTYLSDIMPSLLDYLKLPIPSTVEAKSFYPLFKKPATTLRTQIYNVYGHWSRSVKSKDGWKLIEYNVRDKITVQLFNLKKDPYEINNLAQDKSYAKKLTEMHILLKKEMQAAHDDLDIDLPHWGRKPNQRSFGS